MPNTNTYKIENINYSTTLNSLSNTIDNDKDISAISIDGKKITAYNKLEYYTNKAQIEVEPNEANHPDVDLPFQCKFKFKTETNGINPFVRLLQYIYQHDIPLHMLNYTYAKGHKVYLNSAQLTCLGEQLNRDAGKDNKQVFKAPFVEKNNERPYLITKNTRDRGYFRDKNFLETIGTFPLSTYVFSNDVLGDNLDNNTLLHKLINTIGLSITNLFYFQDILTTGGYNTLTSLFSGNNILFKPEITIQYEGTSQLMYFQDSNGKYLGISSASGATHFAGPSSQSDLTRSKTNMTPFTYDRQDTSNNNTSSYVIMDWVDSKSDAVGFYSYKIWTGIRSPNVIIDANRNNHNRYLARYGIMHYPLFNRGNRPENFYLVAQDLGSGDDVHRRYLKVEDAPLASPPFSFKLYYYNSTLSDNDAAAADAAVAAAAEADAAADDYTNTTDAVTKAAAAEAVATAAVKAGAAAAADAAAAVAAAAAGAAADATAAKAAAAVAAAAAAAKTAANAAAAATFGKKIFVEENVGDTPVHPINKVNLKYYKSWYNNVSMFEYNNKTNALSYKNQNYTAKNDDGYTNQQYCNKLSYKYFVKLNYYPIKPLTNNGNMNIEDLIEIDSGIKLKNSDYESIFLKYSENDSSDKIFRKKANLGYYEEDSTGNTTKHHRIRNVGNNITYSIIKHLIFMKAYAEYLSRTVYEAHKEDETFKKFYNFIIYNSCNQIVDFFIANILDINVSIRDHFNELLLLEFMMLKEKLFQERINYSEFETNQTVNFSLGAENDDKLNNLIMDIKRQDANEEKYKHDLTLQKNKNIEFENQKRHLRNMYIFYISLVVIYALFMIYFILYDMPYFNKDQKSVILIGLSGIVSISIIGNELHKLMVQQQMIEGFFDNGTSLSASSIYSLTNSQDLTDFRQKVDTYHRGKIKICVNPATPHHEKPVIINKYNYNVLKVVNTTNLKLEYTSKLLYNQTEYTNYEGTSIVLDKFIESSTLEDLNASVYNFAYTIVKDSNSDDYGIAALNMVSMENDVISTTNNVGISQKQFLTDLKGSSGNEAIGDNIYIIVDIDGDKQLQKKNKNELLVVEEGIHQYLSNYQMMNNIYNNLPLTEVDINYLSNNKLQNNIRLKNLSAIEDYQYRLLDFSYNQYIYLTNYLKIITIALSIIFILINLAEQGYFNKNLSLFVIIFIMIIVFFIIIIHKTTEVKKKEYNYNQYKYKKVGSIS